MNEQMELTPQEMVSKAVIGLIQNSPWLTAAILNLTVVEDERAETMCTNGEYLRYNAEFVKELGHDLSFCVMHEVFHCILLHCFRRGGRDPLKWNVAADIIVNIELVRMGYEAPTSSSVSILIEPSFDNMTVEQVYEEIKEVENESYGKIMRDLRETSGPGKKLQRKLLEGKWKEIAKSVSTTWGENSADMQRVFEILKPILPWDALLHGYLSSRATADWSWRRPNRRFPTSEIRFPSLRREEEIEIAIAVDSSGSISDKDFSRFVTEVASILDNNIVRYVLHFYVCDCRINDYKLFYPGDVLAGMELHGHGGTSFIPVIEDLNNKNIDLSCLIYFTDGYGSFPSKAPNYDVLWLVTSEVNPPFGKVIRYEKEGDNNAGH